MSRVLLFLWLLFLPITASAMNYSMTLQKYADEIEYFYERPRMELLYGMLGVMDRGGKLANAEKRMFAAAFLAELLKEKRIDLNKLRAKNAPNSRNVNEVLAWAAHLAGVRREVWSKLIAGRKLLIKHIASTPNRLESWQPLWEKSVIDMYWAAFMASGKEKWIDGIIRAALHLAHNPDGAVARHAAATLYEYAPRHAKARARLEARQKSADEAERALIGQMLAGQ